ncbi:MAG: hypothetical protein J0H82_26425 [Alphaproteobacteria bacterium]|jgi:hypothetical protein|nr:hypothetical protein [Alphaproteobacteria bacterium]
MAPPADDYIWFVMLNQGGGRAVTRDEVPAAALGAVRPLVERDGPKPFDLGFLRGELLSIARGATLVASVRSGGRDLCRIGICNRSQASKGLWRDLHGTPLAAYATAGLPPRQAPRAALGLARFLRDEPREVVHAMIGWTKAIAWCWASTAGRQAGCSEEQSDER